jgi:tetratricopeptide (TPR) repeat protein
MSTKRRSKTDHRHSPHLAWEREIPSWISCLIICVVGVLVYSDSFQNSFHFDDETSIVNNLLVRQLGDLKDLFRYSPTRFVTFVSIALNFSVNGLNVFGYHVVNLAIHLASALALWLFARQVLRTPAMKESGLARAGSLVPLLAALIFVAHPVQTQAVTYITQRAAALATLAYLLSLYFYGEARIHQLTGARKSAAVSFTISAGVALIGAFSKETALTLPFAAILYELFFFREIRRIKRGHLAAVSALFVVMALLIFSQKLVSINVAGAVPPAEYLMTQPRVWLTYLRLLMLPVNQNLDYDFAISRSIFEWSTLLSIVALAGLAYLAYRFFKSQRILAFGIFWFMLTLLPESSIVPLPDVIYEHRLYLPLAGFSLVTASVIFGLTTKWKSASLAALFVVVVGGFGLAAFERNKVWTDELTLWSDVTTKSPQKARGFLNLGRAYADRGLFREAYNNFNIALRIDPAFGDVYGNRASILVQQGQLDEAIADCNRAFALGGNLQYQRARIYFNRGTAYLKKNSLDSALADLTLTVGLDPNHETGYFNRAIVYTRKGHSQKAIDDYSSTLVLNPRNAKALNNRGLILKDRGQLNEALADFNNAISSQADFPAPYLNRGTIFALRGQLDQAIDDFSAYIKFFPNSFDALYDRGIAYARKQDYDKALSDFNRVLGFNGSYGPAYIDRAKVLLAMHQYAAADRDLKQAKALGLPVDPTVAEAVKKGMK